MDDDLDNWDDFESDDDDCDCVDAVIDTFLGTAYCPRCHRGWGLTSEQLERELKLQAECEEAYRQEIEAQG